MRSQEKRVQAINFSEPDDDELLEIPESVETEEDEADAGGEGDSGNIRETPIEVTPLQCPNDCLVVYPVMPGKNF